VRADAQEFMALCITAAQKANMPNSCLDIQGLENTGCPPSCSIEEGLP
jgi:hypothetical protein